jgi:hypothetical protein
LTLASVYLHGFASSPSSSKARYLGDALQKHGAVVVPDLNLPSFTGLTVTRMGEATVRAVAQVPDPVMLVGSSMGGYVAARHVANGGRAAALVLLAPALDPAELWTKAVSDADRETWERQGTWPVFHYAMGRENPLGYAFYQEVVTLPAYPDASRVPTLILHGLGDKVVPPRISQTYQGRHPETRLELLDTDHQMADALPLVLERIERFVEEISCRKKAR